MKTTIEIPSPAKGIQEDKDLAREIRIAQLIPALEAGRDVVLDFEAVRGTTQSFMHALVGEAFKRYGDDALKRITFKNCNQEIQSIVGLVADYTLVGFGLPKVSVRPELYRWARERSELPIEVLITRFPKYQQWEKGEESPTLRQLERLAKVTMTPIGYFFLPAPPAEQLPISDFRTVGNQGISRISPNLLETVFTCQRRQEWYREYCKTTRSLPLPFVGSARLDTPVEEAAAQMRSILKFDLDQRRTCPTWTDALRRFVSQADELGILVMCSGVVMNNSHRHLNPEEFRGFAISDDLAPLVFINGADTKSAQMFTLAHELAHVWLGQSAVSDSDPSILPRNEVENWCNRVAAEMLVPLKVLSSELDRDADLALEISRLARCFKVSTLVILRRIHDAGGLSRHDFREAYRDELERIGRIPKGGGGNFYLMQAARVSKQFARCLVVSTLEGQTSFTEAFRLLGVKKMATFHEFGRSLGVAV